MPTRSLLVLVTTLLLLAGVLPSVCAQTAQTARGASAVSGGQAAAPVAFPAAARIKPSERPVGPSLTPPDTNGIGTALLPNDILVFDPSYSGNNTPQNPNTSGAIINLSVRNNSTVGTESVLASSSAGSGAPYFTPGSGDHGTITDDEFSIAPSGLIYYLYQRVVSSIGYFDVVEITPTTGVRRVVSSGSDTNLGRVVNFASSMCYDYSTGTLLMHQSNTNVETGRGIYRVNIATGVRTLVQLDSATPSTVPTAFVNYLAADPFGNLFYTDPSVGTTNGYPDTVVQIPVTADASGTYGTRRIVSNNTSTYPGYSTAPFNYIRNVQVDNTQAVTLSGGLPVADFLIVGDEGADQSSSDIYRVPTNTGAHTQLITSATNTGSTAFDLPNSPQIDTTGRIYYQEKHNNVDAPGTGNNVNTGNVIPTGTKTDTTLAGVQNLSSQIDCFRVVPPPTPTVAAGTVSNNVNGSAATLNSNVTADGGVQNSGIFQRGFVYSATATNNAPQIGGMGVTPVSTLSLITLPATQGSNLGAFSTVISGLSQGTSYTFSAYARDASGFSYGAPVAFTTATLPTVTTPRTTAITGVSATLSGNVTSDGGGTLTARGIVYSATATNGNPIIGATGVTNIADASATTGVFTDGTGNNLANGTGYSYKAYATNGVGTAYTPVATFTTAAPPTANAQSVTTAFNTAKAITLTGSDPNTPAQTLTYVVATAPAHGTLAGTAPNLTYTPTAGYNGADSFTFTVTNTANLTSAAATVSITVAPGTPTANNQSVTVPFNTATAITLTATDPDSPALTLTYTVVAAPTHGTLSGTAPNLTYTPSAGYQGADSFTFRVSNGTNTSNTATVSITVAAGTPTANPRVVSTNFNTAVGFTLSGTDPDSPALALSYTVATAPAHGTLSGTAPNLTYTPTAGYQGADSFNFTVSNGQKTSTPATVSLTVSAGTPTATARSVNVPFNTATAITLSGTDPDSPALPLTYTVATTPTNGTLSGTAPNLTYTPTTGFSGNDSFTFTVSNGQNTSTAATVSIRVIGQPYLTGFSPASGPLGTTITINGSQFTGATGVTFFRNVAATTFTLVSDTQITVVVPTGATTGTMRVNTTSGSNTSTTKFTVTP